MKALQDLKNNLLKRREIKMIVEAKGNPGFSEGLKIISSNFKSPEENIVVKNVKGKFGRDTFLIDAFIYDSVKDKEAVEPKPKVKKGAEAAQAVPAAEAKK